MLLPLYLRDDALRGNTQGATYDPHHIPEYVDLPRGLRMGHDYIATAQTLPIYETAKEYKGAVFSYSRHLGCGSPLYLWRALPPRVQEQPTDTPPPSRPQLLQLKEARTKTAAEITRV